MCEEKLGVVPKPEQLEVLECIAARRDCVLIAPTGWGKTLAYTLPLLLWSDAVILVITPLKVLGKEQSDKLRDLNIECVNITEDDKDINAVKVLQGNYRAIFVSPEMLLESDRLKGLWKNKKWTESIRAVVVDEAHCIEAWGLTFRRAFGELAKPRHRLANRTPFLAVSATLPNAVLKSTILSLDMENPKVISVGNDRPNIMYKIGYLKNGISTFQDLRFLEDRVKTIIYFDNRDLAEQAGHFLRTWIGQDQVKVYHGFKTEDLKDRRMKEFRESKFNILVATEAAGMGCDIKDIVRVVQYGYPPDINCLVQRLGRAARDGTSQGYGIFLVPRSAPKPNLRKKKPPGQDLKDLVGLVDYPGCRRKYLNDFYGNNHIPATGKCCDICCPDEVEDNDDSAITRPADKPSKREKCDKNEAEQVRNALIAWRQEMYEEHYSGRMHDTEETVMTDYMLNKAVKGHKNIIEAGSIDVLKWDPLNDTFAGQVLDLIKNLNEQFLGERQEREISLGQEKERKQLSGRAPSFRIPPLAGATTGQQEKQDVPTVWQQETREVTTVSHDQKCSNQQENRTEDLKQQQANGIKGPTQSLLKPLQTPSPSKKSTSQKKGQTPKKKELKIKQYFPPIG